MRILHTSDWHLGRTFHGHPTLEHLAVVLDALVGIVRSKRVDVVVVAGDVFDSAAPSGDCMTRLTAVLSALRDAGARVIVTSGNHDAPARLGFQSEFLPFAGLHVRTDPGRLAEPVVIDDEHGQVRFYGVPYLEPSIVRRHWPDEPARTQAQVMGLAMRDIRGDLESNPARSVVISHCFAAGGAAEEAACDVEREIRVGSLDVVPLSAFEGIDYVALGHIHGRSVLAPHVRYSGAPLHYSFSEAAKPRGAWLVDLDADGLRSVEWAALPVPRRLAVLTGTIGELLSDDRYAVHEQDWVSAVLTDVERPMDAMRRLQARFPFCATLEHRPATVHDDGRRSYAERVRAARSDLDIIDGFLGHVRNGAAADDDERMLLHDVVSAQRAKEVAA